MRTGWKDDLDRARSRDATPDELRTLAESPWTFVRRAVAANTGTPPAVLGALVPLAVTSWTDDEMLAVLVKNPHTPASALGAIARLVPARLHVPDAPLTFRLGIALFTRPDTPDDVLFALLDDPDTTTQFRKVAAREAIQPSVRERLSTDRSERVRRAAARSNPT